MILLRPAAGYAATIRTSPRSGRHGLLREHPCDAAMGGHRAGRAMLYPALLLSVLLVGQVTPKSHSSHQKPLTLLGLPKQQKYLLAGAHAAIQSWANVSESSKCKPPSSLPAMTPRDESLANGSFAVCVMALNEGNFVAEFIDFYLMQNAAHIFFYVDSGTTDNTKDVLAPYVAAGKVTLHDWPPERGSAMVGCSHPRPAHIALELLFELYAHIYVSAGKQAQENSVLNSRRYVCGSLSGG
eukprot:6182342-Pleurochrysis_carterae.AAC.4